MRAGNEDRNASEARRSFCGIDRAHECLLTRHNGHRHGCTDRFRRGIPFARLDGQSAQDLRGDAADRVLELGRNIVDEHSERIDHVGAETDVGQIERSDEEGKKLNENIVIGVSRKYNNMRRTRETDLGQFRQCQLFRDVPQQGRERDEVDILLVAFGGGRLVQVDEFRQQVGEEALTVQELSKEEMSAGERFSHGASRRLTRMTAAFSLLSTPSFSSAMVPRLAAAAGASSASWKSASKRSIMA